MPQLRRMVPGPGHSLDDLRDEVARSVRALSTGEGAPGQNRRG
ncbi:MAG: hypothetical protein ACJ736_30745 [Streptomyces sp.]